MKRIFVRLVTGGLLAASISPGLALANDEATIHLTGPGSRNIITDKDHSSFSSRINNDVDLNNFNFQTANTGDVWIKGNTKVLGHGLGSGDASNYNATTNRVNLSNDVGGWGGLSWGGGGGDATIHLTGPHSTNIIKSDSSRSFTSNIRNDVDLTNVNKQSAESGDVNVRHNTLVAGAGGSGDATNYNATTNVVNLQNDQPGFHGFGGGGGTDAFIGLTGPGSKNIIHTDDSSRVNLTTNNDVDVNNVNFQKASTGDVNVSGNTLVAGVGGSGDATNWNDTANLVNVSNH